MNWFVRRGRALRLPGNKNTMDCETVSVPTPETVTIQLATYGVTGARPLVKKGERISKGAVLAEAEGPLAVPVYSSVAGIVRELGEITTPMGHRSPYVKIEAQGDQTAYFIPPKAEGPKEFLQAVRRSGLVGLGGAGFPTFKKLDTNGRKVNTLLINGAECEPYITSDYREMIEFGERVIRGVCTVKEMLNADSAVICIEDNKPKAVSYMQQLTAGMNGIMVQVLPTAYPGGAEKTLMLHTLGKMPAPGQIPLDLGVVVINVSTVSALQKYLETGEPLYSRRITVDGDAVLHPGNYQVPIGMMLDDLMAFCGVKCEIGTLLMGGPMMGIALPTGAYPVLANNNGILAFGRSQVMTGDPCIRCGRCASVCPLHLMPAAIDRAVAAGNTEKLLDLQVMSCMECGCCSYVCPAHRHLVQTNRLAKTMLKKEQK